MKRIVLIALLLLVIGLLAACGQSEPTSAATSRHSGALP